jgi:branched-chain amino acid transport system substrate-binding protein
MRVGRGRTIAFALVLTVALVPWSFTGAHGEQTQATGKIKVGVSVPLKAVQGELIWYGAEMAAKEINGAGGVNVGGKKYEFELIKADSNEYASIPDAVATHERLMTVDKVNFVMGGGRSEAALAQQELLPKYKVINLDVGASDVKLLKRVKEEYASYKYFFHIVHNKSICRLGRSHGTPLVQLPFERFREMGIEKPRVAIVAEKVGYADVMVKILEDLVKKLGGEVVSVHRPSFTADTLLGELTAIKSSDVHLIIPCISGISGLPLVKEWAQLKVPAAPVRLHSAGQA